MISLIVSGLLISFHGFSQDTTYHSGATQKSGTQTNSQTGFKKSATHTAHVKKPIYRDTRLGSSSKKYNTYKKNDNGAGAVTTNPNK